MEIQTFTLKLTGSFTYDPDFIRHQRGVEKYKVADWFEQNKTYLNQKYYSNWLKSIFWDQAKLKDHGLDFLRSNHLRLNKNASIFQHDLCLACRDDLKEVSLDFRITSIEAILLREKIGMFVIGITLESQHLNWRDVTLFTRDIRRTTRYDEEESPPILVDVIEKYISGYFHPDSSNWRIFHPQLKSVILVDIDKGPGDEQMDNLLYDLASFADPINRLALNEAEDGYLKSQTATNTIKIFKNWRAICLEDAFVRVAINLKDKDKFKLWENEYILIYIYVLFARHYLYRCNARLGEVSSNERLIRETRNNFIEFMNEFEFTRISYKFLPNAIFQQTKQSLQIDDEIRVVEKEIARINTLFKEYADDRLGKVILALTALTIISVAYDASQLILKIADPESAESWTIHITVTMTVMMAFGLFLVWIFWKKYRR